MKRIILLTFLVGLISHTHAQVTVSIDSTGSSCFGPTNLVANVAGPMGTESYTISQIPYAPEAYVGNPITLFDDDVSPALPIGFDFCFLGQTYNQFYIGSNGWISFSPGQTTAYTALPIPDPSPLVPKNAIMGPWEDWNPGIGGQIMFQTVGSFPNRKLIVSWLNVPMYQCTGNFGSFQIVLHEANSLIENHLTDKPNCPSWANGAGTQGIHDDLGTLAFVDPNRNSTQWITNNESTAFIPDGIVWYQGGVIVGLGDTLQVPAGSSGTYVAQVTLCDGTIQADSVTVTPTGTSASIVETPTLCNGDSTGWAAVVIAGGNPADYTYQWDDANMQTTDTAWNLPAGTYTVTLTGVLNACTSTMTAVITEPAAITASTTSTVACDSTATATLWIDAVAGGTSPYTYSIDGGLTYQPVDTFYNLTPGVYPIIVQDSAGCMFTVTDTVLNSNSPVIDSVSTNNPSCVASDGSVTVYASGSGTLIYSISGSGASTNNIFTNLGVGTYTITVNDLNGCSSTTTATLINPSAPVIDNIIEIDPGCGVDDGSITIVASGINPPFEYSFDNGLSFSPINSMTNLAPGTYLIVVRDASGCQATATVTLQDNEFPVIDSLTITHPLCVGDSGYVTVHASGGAWPLFYSMDNGVNFSPDSTFGPMDAGNFTVTVGGSNACWVDTTFTINAPDTVIASFNALPSSGPDPLPVDFINNSSGATSYLWDFGNGSTSTDTAPSIVYSPKGQYLVTLIATNGNCSDTATRVIDVFGEGTLIIPNVFSPNGDGVNDVWAPITANIVSMDVQIFNQWGNLLYSWTGTNGSWDGGNHPDGTYYYIVTATTADGNTYNENGTITLFH